MSVKLALQSLCPGERTPWYPLNKSVRKVSRRQNSSRRWKNAYSWPCSIFCSHYG